MAPRSRRRRLATAAMLLLLLVVSPPAHATLLDAVCRLSFRLFGARPPVPALPPPWTSWSTLQPRLREAHAHWLAERRRAAEFLEQGALRIGERVTNLGADFRIVEYLGGGNEGHVYVVDTFSGPRVIKVFKPHVDARFNIEEMQADPLPSPRVHYIDDEHRTVMMDYHRGVPVAALLRDGERYGLRPAEVNEIGRHFRRLGVTPENVILDVDSGVFYEIDPF